MIKLNQEYYPSAKPNIKAKKISFRCQEAWGYPEKQLLKDEDDDASDLDSLASIASTKRSKP